MIHALLKGINAKWSTNSFIQGFKLWSWVHLLPSCPLHQAHRFSSKMHIKRMISISSLLDISEHFKHYFIHCHWNKSINSIHSYNDINLLLTLSLADFVQQRQTWGRMTPGFGWAAFGWASCVTIPLLGPHVTSLLRTISLYGRWSTSGSDRGIAHFFTATRNTIEGAGEKKREQTNKMLGLTQLQKGSYVTLCICRLTLAWILAKIL